MMTIFKSKAKKQTGFTLIELVVTVTIFAFMTALLLAKYGKFNQDVLLTNLAYDVALTIRNAQTFGLNVRVDPQTLTAFDKAYGVHFRPGNSFIFFVDTDGDSTYDAGEQIGSPYVIRRTNLTISKVCGFSAASCTVNDQTMLDVLFRRPDPNAIIRATTNGTSYTEYPTAQITLTSSDGYTRVILIRSTGQIAVI